MQDTVISVHEDYNCSCVKLVLFLCMNRDVQWGNNWTPRVVWTWCDPKHLWFLSGFSLGIKTHEGDEFNRFYWRVNVWSIDEFRGQKSKTSASASSRYPDTEKQMKGRDRRPSAFIVLRWFWCSVLILRDLDSSYIHFLRFQLKNIIADHVFENALVHAALVIREYCFRVVISLEIMWII